jgi:hypothetical protein
MNLGVGPCQKKSGTSFSAARISLVRFRWAHLASGGLRTAMTQGGYEMSN